MHTFYARITTIGFDAGVLAKFVFDSQNSLKSCFLPAANAVRIIRLFFLSTNTTSYRTSLLTDAFLPGKRKRPSFMSVFSTQLTARNSLLSENAEVGGDVSVCTVFP
jgi:hypothetical protein